MIWLICMAGGVGAVSRYHLDRTIESAVDKRIQRYLLPYGTLSVNIIGSFIIGFITVIMDNPVMAIITTGFCGGFTTFSTYCWQLVEQILQRRSSAAITYCLLTSCLCLFAVWLGMNCADLLVAFV